MKPEIKARWVAALRSGEFVQGSGTLCCIDDDGTYTYCCLGVLCHILKDEVPGLNVEQRCDRIAFNDKVAFLPASVMDYAGLDDKNPVAGYLTLSTYNDRYNCTFPQIADLIEKHL